MGLTVAFTFLLATVQLLARLHHATVATALATEAARAVAETDAGGRPRARATTEERLHALLGREAELTWRLDADDVRLTVQLPGPAIPGLDDRIRRTVVVRTERRP